MLIGRSAGTKSQKEGLGNRFLAAFPETIDRIGLNPEGYAKVVAQTRKANFEKFPYALFFTVGDKVLVVASLHRRRDARLVRERALGVVPTPDPS